MERQFVQKLMQTKEYWFNVDFKKLENLRFISKYGDCKLYKARYGGRSVEVKRFGPDKGDAIVREIEALQKMDHPNVVSLIGVSERKMEEVVIVTTYIHGYNLQELIEKTGQSSLLSKPISLLNKLFIVRKIALGLCHIHTQMIAHRNLALRCIWVSTDLEEVRISDFTEAKEIPRNASKSNQAAFYTDHDYFAKDIYCLGVIFISVLLDVIIPHDSPAGLVTKYLENLKEPAGKWNLDGVYKLVCDMVNMDRNKRPTAAKVAAVITQCCETRGRICIGTKRESMSLNGGLLPFVLETKIDLGNSKDNRITCLSEVVTPQGEETLWMGCKDGSVRIYKSSMKQEMCSLTTSGDRILAMTQAGASVWVSTEDGIIHVWDEAPVRGMLTVLTDSAIHVWTSSPQEPWIRRWNTVTLQLEQWVALEEGSTPTYMSSYGRDHVLVASKSEIFIYHSSKLTLDGKWSVLQFDTVQCLFVAPKQKVVYSGTRNGVVQKWKMKGLIASLEQSKTIEKGNIRSLLIDGKYLLCSCNEGVYVLNSLDLSIMHILPHDDTVYKCVISGDRLWACDLAAYVSIYYRELKQIFDNNANVSLDNSDTRSELDVSIENDQQGFKLEGHKVDSMYEVIPRRKSEFYDSSDNEEEAQNSRREGSGPEGRGTDEGRPKWNQAFVTESPLLSPRSEWESYRRKTIAEPPKPEKPVSVEHEIIFDHVQYVLENTSFYPQRISELHSLAEQEFEGLKMQAVRNFQHMIVESYVNGKESDYRKIEQLFKVRGFERDELALMIYCGLDIQTFLKEYDKSMDLDVKQEIPLPAPEPQHNMFRKMMIILCLEDKPRNQGITILCPPTLKELIVFAEMKFNVHISAICDSKDCILTDISQVSENEVVIAKPLNHSKEL